MMTPGPATTLIEMQPMGRNTSSCPTAPSSIHLSTSNKSSPARSQRRTRPTDLASFDSSDTWASCNPFPSITDLAGWSPQSGTGPAERDASELYVKPLEKENKQQHYVTVDETSRLLYQSINEQADDDDSPVKAQAANRKIQTASNKPRPRFKEAFSSDEEERPTNVVTSTSSSKNKDSGGGGFGLKGGGIVSSVNKKFRQKSSPSSSGKPSFLTGKGIASATRFLNYRFHSLQSADNRGRASPDRKKSILKRSGEVGGGGGGGSTSVGSTSAGALSDQDTEMEKLIGGEGGGATASESGSEPFSPVVAQRSTNRRRMNDALVGGGGNKTRPSETADSGHISINMGGNLMTSCALDDWPFADYSPTEEAINSGHPSTAT